MSKWHVKDPDEQDQDERGVRRELRRVIVVQIESGGKTVLVQNPKGRRRDWQLPGSLMNNNGDPLLAASRIVFQETGLKIPQKDLKLVRKTRRETDDATQIVYLYRVELPIGGLQNLLSVSPNGHKTKLEPSNMLNRVLGSADLQLVTE